VARIRTDDGVDLYYESTGDGPPLLFLHEFAGDHRSWDAQVAHFAGRYQCIVYAARGYQPSSVPDDGTAYSKQRAVLDALAILDATGTAAAHVIGLSMGGFCGLHLTDQRPDRVLSLVAASVGYGAPPDRARAFHEDTARTAATFLADGSAVTADLIAHGPGRIPCLTHDPEGWTRFRDNLANHSAIGSANTMLGVEMNRETTRPSTMSRLILRKLRSAVMTYRVSSSLVSRTASPSMWRLPLPDPGEGRYGSRPAPRLVEQCKKVFVSFERRRQFVGVGPTGGQVGPVL